ncbi:hypothetical protein J3E69DRAFT_257569 [Trichoderma sp. SZMC 28015]
MLLCSALLLLQGPSLCGSGNMVSFNTYEYLTKRRGVREKGLVVNETVWPCDWIMFFCLLWPRAWLAPMSICFLPSSSLGRYHHLIIITTGPIAVPCSQGPAGFLSVPWANERVSQLVGRDHGSNHTVLADEAILDRHPAPVTVPPIPPFFLP